MIFRRIPYRRATFCTLRWQQWCDLSSTSIATEADSCEPAIIAKNGIQLGV
jgi:hypothetical protein